MRNLLCLVGIFASIQSVSVPTSAAGYDDGFGRRADHILRHTADAYQPPAQNIGDPEKYYWPRALARFHRYGVSDSLANHWIDEMAGNNPFHFTLVGMARLLYQYPDAPAIRKHHQLIIQRVFDRRDSYNAWTGEGTENHVGMSRTSGYLFAQAALSSSQNFPLAEARLKEMDAWIRYWSKAIFRSGTGEWNSSTYLTYNLVGWLNLFDFAKDEEIRSIARAVLDYYATELALHYSFGSMGGSEMRGSNSTVYSATSYLGWLWFGDADDQYGSTEGLKGNQYIQCVHAATSTYRPPVVLTRLARKRELPPEQYTGSQPSYLLEEPSFAKQFFYASPDFTLGSSVSRYGGYTGSTAQIVHWKLVARPKKGDLPYEFYGNGTYFDNMPLYGRDPFTQVVQYKNTLIQMTCVPPDEADHFKKVTSIVNEWRNKWRQDFKARFPQDTEKKNIVTLRENRLGLNGSFVAIPGNALIDSSGATVWISAGEALVLIRSVSGQRLKRVVQSNRVYLTDQQPRGTVCGIILEVHSRRDVSDPGAFRESITHRNSLQMKGMNIVYTTSAGDVIDATYSSKGRMTEAVSDWGYGKLTPHSMLTSPPLRQPDWPQGYGWGKIPDYRVNNKVIDLQKPWPVWQSRYLRLDKMVLRINDGQSVYEVNYQGKRPTFNQKEI